MMFSNKHKLFRGVAFLLMLLISSMYLQAETIGELVEAVRAHNALEIVPPMLRRIEDINAKDSAGYSPLQAALYHGSKGVVQMLLRAGARVDINLLTNTVRTSGWKEDVQSLINYFEGDINQRDKNGDTPLKVAVRYGRLEFIEPLFRAGARIDGGLLELAVRGGESESNRSMEQRAKSDGTTFLFPCQQTYNKIAQLLIEKGAYIKAELIETALLRGKRDTADILVEGISQHVRSNIGETIEKIAEREKKRQAADPLFRSGDGRVDQLGASSGTNSSNQSASSVPSWLPSRDRLLIGGGIVGAAALAYWWYHRRKKQKQKPASLVPAESSSQVPGWGAGS